MSIQTKLVEYRDGNSELSGMLAWDLSASEKRPGVLVVHSGAGLDEHAQGRAKRMAELGYVVLACDMYGAGVIGNRERTMALLLGFKNDRAKLCTRARKGLEVLRAQPQVNGRIGAVGYCFGGMAVLELARAGEQLAGVVTVHGSLDTPRRAEKYAVKAKVLVCHGAIDPHVPTAQVNGFAEEMEAAGANWELDMYGGAMHGFTHETGPYPPGVAYHAQADARSGVAIRNFFAEVLR